MNTLEKTEILREKADISYEEAKKLLDETNGDLLDAIVILERQGKVGNPKTDKATFSETESGGIHDAENIDTGEDLPVEAEITAAFVDSDTFSDNNTIESEAVFMTAEEESPAKPAFVSQSAADEKTNSSNNTKKDRCGKKVSKAMEKIMNVLKNNSFNITRKEDTLFSMPVWAFALIILFTWKWMIPVMIISLFFQVRYSFDGKDDLSVANDFMNKAGDIAENVACEFNGR